MDVDFEDLFNLEEKFYQEGYAEAQSENVKHNYIEGKQYGLQVGFQRFVLLGQMLSICDFIESLKLNNKLLDKNLLIVKNLINEIPMNNNEDSVEIYEKNIVKLKNKFRTIIITFQKCYNTKENLKNHDKLNFNFDDVENLSRQIAGEIRGFVEDAETSNAKSTQDQAQDW
ncbi:hypothetical protein TBLA_0A05610 [Henningerozyma blattae CBS 6284]|uniref:Essential protein Yae1 N-terminal domain-containing protein n=1 Tax=Henningerozyma blattae (strain ATCC 34711 / CBS 6284 / DSM 70876 / NBRC 10599 / NRRL Y-10934 / UCD 77-7) TaxID=1071380 RepID=I2GW52_HENB6|nr:hypothetical protein TBLA_0A05610 [Tetrapisispora blattae CBS 6284]CCH58354.1 hypothetical protein TBLA_0A05610 [Tetrapisispora blattae CBS 6284]